MSPSTRLAPPSLLTELLEGGLDPGYAEAARRRAERAAGQAAGQGTGGAPTHARRGAELTFVVLAVVSLVLAGVVIAVGWNEAHRRAPAQEVLHDQLVERARAAAGAADGLEQQVTDAAARVAALQGTALSGDASGRAAQAALVAAQVAAGTVAVRGPGLTVTLTDPTAPVAAGDDPATARAGSTPLAQVRIVSDLDLRDLVNVLWSAGAQAVAVNQVRITPVSAIRFAGADILVDLRTVTSPYTVSAVGDAEALSIAFGKSAVAGRFATYASNRGVGFDFDTAADLDLPAGVVADPRYASTPPPAGSAPSSPPPSSPAEPTPGRPSGTAS